MRWLQPGVEALARDVRDGSRLFIRQPAFAAVAVLTLALGTGATTAIFTVLHNTLLRPLPYPQVERLMRLEVRITTDARGPREVGIDSRALDAARSSGVFESLASYSPQTFSLTGAGDTDRVAGEIVSAEYFRILGVTPARGRLFREDEDKAPGLFPVAVISEGMWRSRFAGRADIAGTAFALNRVPLVVVGVIPSWFKGESAKAEVWVPRAMEDAVQHGQGVMFTGAIGRLREGITPARADAEIRGKVAGLPDAARLSMTGGVVPLDARRYDPRLRAIVIVLFGAVSFVLLVASVNLANLLLARGLGRTREIAIRVSLGAGRAALVRQMLVECFVLCLAGAATGLLFAWWGLDALAWLRPNDETAVWPTYLQQFDVVQFRVGNGIGVFAPCLVILTTMVSGVMPALQASRTDVQPALKVDGAGWSGDRRTGRTWRSLIATQVALVLVLLAAAGMMLRSFDRLVNRPVGVDTHGVLTFRVALPTYAYEAEAATAFYDRLMARIRELPGIESVTRVRHLPIRQRGTVTQVRVDAATERQFVGFNAADSAFFQVFRVPLLSGRGFDARDEETRADVVLVSESVARQLFPGDTPLGHRITAMGKTAEIIGVVADVHYEPQQPQLPIAGDIYVNSKSAGTIALRSARDPRGYVPALRQIVSALDPTVPLYDVRTLDEYVAGAQSYTRFTTTLLVAFAGLALTLAMIGLYGTLSYAVASKRREIGIRMALGAGRLPVMVSTLREGLVACGVGLVMGLPMTLVTTRAMQSVLYQTSPADPIVILLAVVLLAVSAAAACLVPARRAASVDPIVAMTR